MRQVKHFKNADGSIYASISINTDTSILLSTWNGELQQAGQVAVVLTYCCEQIKHFQLKHWLSDVTSTSGHYQNLSAEVQKTLLGGLEDSQLESFALVSQRSANPVRSAVIHGVRQFGIEVRTFACFASAMEWLMQSPVNAPP